MSSRRSVPWPPVRSPSPCTIEDAMGTAWIAEAATLSAHEGRPVRIDEVAR